MAKTRVQAVLPESIIDKFVKLAKKQGRSESNLVKKYIIEGLARDEEREVKNGGG